VIAYLRSPSVGARLHGASDPDFNTICVMPSLVMRVDQAWPCRAISQRLTGMPRAPDQQASARYT
jgi:hypothetical protein